jgi:hypothetical protein
MMNKEQITEEIIRSYYNWFNYERECARYSQANNILETFNTEVKKGQEMGKIVAYFSVLGEPHQLICNEFAKTAWDRLSSKGRCELRQESLRKDRELNTSGYLWYSWLTIIDC